MRYDVGLSVALGLALIFATAARVQSQTPDAQSAAANDGPGGAASWTTGNKLAVGTSAGLDSKVWFTVAKGITSEVFYPRLDVPNMEDMQYVVTDGSTFVDLECDATSHAISMPSVGTDKLTGFERTLTIADAGNAASKENGDALEDHD
jgi:glucoamylase